MPRWAALAAFLTWCPIAPRWRARTASWLGSPPMSGRASTAGVPSASWSSRPRTTADCTRPSTCLGASTAQTTAGRTPRVVSLVLTVPFAASMSDSNIAASMFDEAGGCGCGGGGQYLLEYVALRSCSFHVTHQCLRDSGGALRAFLTEHAGDDRRCPEHPSRGLTQVHQLLRTDRH